MFEKFKRTHQYNSRNYDVSLVADAREFEFIIDVLKTFDFVVIPVMTVESVNTTKKNIHVELKINRTLETWLIRMGFEEA